MYQRFDLYGPVHKGIRLALGGLSNQASSVDSSEYEKVQAFIEEFRGVVIILESHSRDEDDNINDSYEKFAPETLLELEQEHEGLEHNLNQLVELVNQFEAKLRNPVESPKLWYQVGKELNRFIADYLIHLQREEGPGMKALWENLSDDELKVISKNIRSSIPPQAMAIFMHYMIPAISHKERVEMFSEMKKFAPKEALAGMLAIAETRLDSKDWVQLKSALAEVKLEGVQNQS